MNLETGLHVEWKPLLNQLPKCKKDVCAMRTEHDHFVHSFTTQYTAQLRLLYKYCCTKFYYGGNCLTHKLKSETLRALIGNTQLSQNL